MLIITTVIILIIQPLYSINIDNRYFFRLISISLIYSSIIVYNCVSTIESNFIVIIYNGSFIINNVLLSIQGFIYIISAIICYTWLSSANLNIKEYKFWSVREHSLIVIFILFGGIIIVSSFSLVSLFICLELQSFSLYVISTICRYKQSATRAGLLYFILGSFSSCIILLGTSIIYSYTGSFNYIDIYQLIQYNDNININIGFTLILIGIIFKISAAPIHNWSPDVYDGVPTIIAIWLTSIPKISLFIVLYIISNIINNAWLTALIFAAIISLIIGSILGITQKKIKRILAYSTISHVGFILVCITINTIESYTAFIFYLVQYVFSNFTIFSLILAIGYNINKNKDVEFINEISGIIRVNFIITLSIAITLLSISGIPPIIGFYAKIQVLYSTIANDYYIISIIAIISSVISTYYYLRIVSIIYFNKPEDSNINYYFISTIHVFTISISIIYITCHVFYPDILLDIITILAVNTHSYILYLFIMINFIYSTNTTIIIYIIIVPIVVIILLLITVLFAPYSPDSEKVSIYESGIISVGETRSQFPISYYVVAILFIIFDIEIILLFPIALCLNTVQSIGFWIVIIFLLILTLGFVFELRIRCT